MIDNMFIKNRNKKINFNKLIKGNNVFIRTKYGSFIPEDSYEMAAEKNTYSEKIFIKTWIYL